MPKLEPLARAAPESEGPEAESEAEAWAEAEAGTEIRVERRMVESR